MIATLDCQSVTAFLSWSLTSFVLTTPRQLIDDIPEETGVSSYDQLASESASGWGFHKHSAPIELGKGTRVSVPGNYRGSVLGNYRGGSEETSQRPGTGVPQAGQPP